MNIISARRRAAAVAAMLLLTTCGQSQPEQNRNFRTLVPTEANPHAPPPPAPKPPPPILPPGTGPDARTPFGEPNPAVDPKSAEAAGQVVQHYGGLIEQHRTTEAEALWGDSDTASHFAMQLRRYPEFHLEIGNPGEPEGAAGSIYVTVPVTFYGKDQNGRDFRRRAQAILRRVNDVPGSTGAQRRWHIERIDWSRVP